eukprot:7535136-Pyramimonas_sp.AAC.1
MSGVLVERPQNRFKLDPVILHARSDALMAGKPTLYMGFGRLLREDSIPPNMQKRDRLDGPMPGRGPSAND